MYFCPADTGASPFRYWGDSRTWQVAETEWGPDAVALHKQQESEHKDTQIVSHLFPPTERLPQDHTNCIYTLQFSA